MNPSTLIGEPVSLSPEDAALLSEWDAFTAEHAKAAQSKGTVGPKSRPPERSRFNGEGDWEHARGRRYQQLVRAGLMPQIKAKFRGHR